MTSADTECRFQITVDTLPVNVYYRPHYIGSAHFEFTSRVAGRPNPTSHTGYRSHFLSRALAAAAPDVETYAHALGVALARGKASADPYDIEEPEQLTLL